MSESTINTFRIGADPEFAINDGNNRCVTFRNTSGDNQVGADHGGALVELRPFPAYSVKEFLNNIKALLNRPELDGYRRYAWRAGALFGGQGMGGHVHFELPCAAGTNVVREVFTKRMEAFDVVNVAFERMNLFPRQECETRRASSGYGTLWNKGAGDGRAIERKGTNGERFEYRSPCSWLFDPRIAFAFLTTLKLAAINPVGAEKHLSSDNQDKLYEGMVKFLRTFQSIDHDAFIAATKICRTANPDNLQRLHVDVSLDFKPNWKTRGAVAMGVTGESTTPSPTALPPTPRPSTIPSTEWEPSPHTTLPPVPADNYVYSTGARGRVGGRETYRASNGHWYYVDTNAWV